MGSCVAVLRKLLVALRDNSYSGGGWCTALGWGWKDGRHKGGGYPGVTEARERTEWVIQHCWGIAKEGGGMATCSLNLWTICQDHNTGASLGDICNIVSVNV